MTNATYTNSDRISGAPWFERAANTCVLIGGAGGISSWLALFLTRAGINTHVIDFDTVSKVNLAGQFYTSHFIGLPKTEALGHEIRRFSDGNKYMGIKNRLDSNSTYSQKIMLAGFDNMTARQDMFGLWLNSLPINNNDDDDVYSEYLFIDGRLLAEQLQIFCIRGNDQEQITKYETEHLFNDSEVPDAACTFKQTSHMAAMIAGLMTGFLTNHLVNLDYKMEINEVPFYHEYLLPVNRTVSENYSASSSNQQIDVEPEQACEAQSDASVETVTPVSSAQGTSEFDDMVAEYQRFSTNYHQT